MSEQSTSGIDRLRMRLAWFIAPNSVQRITRGRLEAIERSAQRIQEYSPRPSHVGEAAQSVERRTRLVKRHLCLDTGTDRSGDGDQS